MANQAVKQLFDTAAATALTDTLIFYTVETPYGVGDDRPMSGVVLKEAIQDLMATTLVGGANIGVVYNDAGGTITISYTGAAPPASTDDLPEGSTNLYYTNARADARIAAAVGVSVQAYSANLTTLAGAFSTTSLPEGTNLYYTDARADARIAAAVGVSVQAFDADLSAIAALASTGFAVRTASNTWAQRSITTTGTNLSITNGDGVAGNPVINMANMAQATVKGRAAGAGTGTPTDLSAANLFTLLGVSTLGQAIISTDVRTTVLQDLGLRRSTITFADDTVASFTTFAYSGTGVVNGSVVLFIPNALTSGPFIGAFCRGASSPLFTLIPSLTHDPSSLLGTTGTSSLSGTTGTDGKINFSCLNDGTIQIENRVGFAVKYTIFPFIST